MCDIAFVKPEDVIRFFKIFVESAPAAFEPVETYFEVVRLFFILNFSTSDSFLMCIIITFEAIEDQTGTTTAGYDLKLNCGISTRT